MPIVLTMEEIKNLNPDIDVNQTEESRSLRQTLLENGVVGRARRIQGYRRGARAQFDDSAQNDPRLVTLHRR